MYVHTTDFFKSGREFSVVWDDELGLLRTHPVPPVETLADYYDSEQYVSHVDNKKGLMPTLYRWVRAYALKSKLALIQRLQPAKGSLLDIGAGTGAFAQAALEKGWKVKAVEPSKVAAAQVAEKGIEVVATLEHLTNEATYDVITLWHVLEHLPELKNAIERIKRLLKPNGVLVIAVPNHLSYDAQHYRSHWAAYDVPRHLWHFSKETLPPLFAPELTCSKIRPMYFDAFYVSLLSEKYKSGRSFSIKALIVGLWSNLKAVRSGEYSSLIYVFKRPNSLK